MNFRGRQFSRPRNSEFSFHFIFRGFASCLKMKRGPYITWTSSKLAAVQPHLYELEEGPRLERAKLALIDAGFPKDAAILTVNKLKTAQAKLAEPQQEAIALNHKQTAKKKNREKQRQSEGELNLRAQSKRLSLKCHPWFFFLTVLSDVANVARIQQQLYPGVGMNGVLPGVALDAGADSRIELAEEDGNISFVIEQDNDLAEGMPLLLPPRIIQAQKGVAGARSVVQIAASQSHMTESLSLQIDRTDAHRLLLSFVYKPEPLAFLSAADEDDYRVLLEGLHVPVEAMTAAHEALTYEPQTFAITIRFSAKLGHQAEVRKFETTKMTVWLVPFEHWKGPLPPAWLRNGGCSLWRTEVNSV